MSSVMLWKTKTSIVISSDTMVTFPVANQVAYKGKKFNRCGYGFTLSVGDAYVGHSIRNTLLKSPSTFPYLPLDMDKASFVEKVKSNMESIISDLKAVYKYASPETILGYIDISRFVVIAIRSDFSFEIYTYSLKEEYPTGFYLVFGSGKSRGTWFINKFLNEESISVHGIMKADEIFRRAQQSVISKDDGVGLKVIFEEIKDIDTFCLPTAPLSDITEIEKQIRGPFNYIPFFRYALKIAASSVAYLRKLPRKYKRLLNAWFNLFYFWITRSYQTGATRFIFFSSAYRISTA